jgi:predicted nucleic acid-binding Zn ribbon protein
MIYLYKCDNESCKNVDIIVEIQKPIKDSDRKEACEWCTGDLKRVYTAPGVKTSDGYKT